MVGNKFVTALWNEDVSQHTRSTRKWAAEEEPLLFAENTPNSTFLTVGKVSLLMAMQPLKHWL